MPDSIARPTKFQIQGPIENLAVKTDSLSGTTSYYISVGSNEKSETSQSPILWKGLFFSVLLLLFIGTIWFLLRRKRSANPLPQPQNEQEAFLRNELFRQTDIYKECVRKGYYSVNRNTSLEVLKEQEINELCDAVTKIFASFSEFLREKELSDKDFQFCCLVKSGLTTFELSEIYCVSESAIFKRKQRMKEKLGFSPEARTLDEILQRL